MNSLVTLLEHPSEVRSLLVMAKLVQLLLVMLAPQVCGIHQSINIFDYRDYLSHVASMAADILHAAAPR